MHSHCAHPKFRCVNRQYATRARVSYFEFKFGFASIAHMDHLALRAYRASLEQRLSRGRYCTFASTSCVPVANVALPSPFVFRLHTAPATARRCILLQES